MVSHKGKPARIDDETRRQVVEAIKAGGKCREVARRFGIAASSVRNILAAFGIDGAFDRTATENATRAKTVDMAARRAELASLLLEDAFELRQRARSGYTLIERGPDGPVKVEVDIPPARETRELYTALGIAIDKSRHLLQQDSGTGSGAEIDRWLRDMIGDAAMNAANQHAS